MCNKDKEHVKEYFKDNSECEYTKTVSGLSFCIWTNTLCKRVPDELCAQHDDPNTLNGESNE